MKAPTSSAGESAPDGETDGRLLSRAPILPLLEETREWRERWDPILKPEGPHDWFDGTDSIAGFDPDRTGFCAANAWWLSELCRIAYTPDGKESDRLWNRDKPARHTFLEARTPFREVINLHKTGNHVSLYRLAEGAGHVLCFRGTNKLRQWLMNLTAVPSSWQRGCEKIEGVCVHQGFQILFERVWPLLEPALSELDGPLIFTGHSLGGAFATLAAVSSPIPAASLVTFGSPRVGNQAFLDCLGEIPIHRVVHHHDIVPLLPQTDTQLGHRDFRHAGDLIYLGERPGVVHRQPGPESPEDPDWQPPHPLDLLRPSWGKSEPPECLLDHAPAAYSSKLRVLALSERA